jgi:hypothetical protein
MPHLENWKLLNPIFRLTKFSPHHADFLHGEVTGSNLIADGERVFTSPVTHFDTAAMVATTLTGTEYTLGQPSPEYAEFLKEHVNGK